MVKTLLFGERHTWNSVDTFMGELLLKETIIVYFVVQ